MKKYWRYFITMLKLNTAYKADYIFSLFADTIFFFISFALWRIIFSEGNLTQINTYSLQDTITYFFVTSILFRLEVSNSIFLGWQIWSGFFTNDLIKPWSIYGISVIDTIAEKFFITTLYIPVLAVIFFVAHQYIQLPSGQNLIFFLISVVLAFFLGVTFNLIFHALTFFYGDQDANIELINYLALFFAGAFFPLAFLPHKLYLVFQALPFKNIFFVPIEIFLGKLPPEKIYSSWLETILWIIAFYLTFKILYKRGLKYYTGTGR